MILREPVEDMINRHLLGGGIPRLQSMGFPASRLTKRGADETVLLTRAAGEIASIMNGRGRPTAPGTVRLGGMLFPAKPAVFAACSMILDVVSDIALTRKYCMHKATELSDSMGRQWNDWGGAALLSMIRYQTNGDMFDVSVPDYLVHSASISTREWRLVNRNVHGGMVHGLGLGEMTRLARSYIVHALETMMQRTRVDAPGFIDEYACSIRDLGPIYAPVGRSGWPPCVMHAIKELKNGANLPHSGRFLIAAYTLKTGVSAEDVAGYFVSAPNYDKNKTRTQIAQIQKNDYMPASCSRIEQAGLCYRNKMCSGIKNPIQYG